MTHSPPIPPGNQPPYPRVEPPHAKPANDDKKKSSEPTITAKTSAKARELAPALIAGAVVAGAAAIATVVVRSRRNADESDKSGKSAKSKNSGSEKSKKSKAKGSNASSGGASKASGDDKSIRGPQDASRIAMNEDYEVRYWTEKFGVDREALQKAVDAVGNGADAVEKELGKA